MEPHLAEHRTLTDEDVKAIADALEKKLINKFYADLGKGVWGLVWKAIVTGIIIIAAYGAAKGGKLP